MSVLSEVYHKVLFCSHLHCGKMDEKLVDFVDQINHVSLGKHSSFLQLFVLVYKQIIRNLHCGTVSFGKQRKNFDLTKGTSLY